MRRPRAVRTIAVIGLVLGVVTLAGCSGSSLSSTKKASKPTTGTSTRPTTAPTMTVPPTTTTTVPPTTTTTTEQPGWSVVGTVGGATAVDEQTLTGADGGQVTVFRFRSNQVQFNLHVGSSDPPTNGATLGPDSGEAIGTDEAPRLLAAFNGGFEMSAGAGGFEVDGQVLSPLVSGMASLVIDADGSASVGVWGSTVPVSGEQVASVRQNLPPLVSGGQPSSDIDDVSAWGATLGGGTTVARSALGEDAQGNLIYAAGMSLQPADLASALVSAGAVSAMELDINPEWVQLDVAATPGATLTTGIPGQNRPADQYQEGWTRDFVTVLAAG